jgi:hypothetical protein
MCTINKFNRDCVIEMALLKAHYEMHNRFNKNYLQKTYFTLKRNFCNAVLRIYKPQLILVTSEWSFCYLLLCVRIMRTAFWSPLFQCRCCLAGDAQSASFPLPFSVMRFCDMGPTATP